MLRTSMIKGQSAVDLQTAQKLGQVDDVVLDGAARRIVALDVAQAG